MTERFLTG